MSSFALIKVTIVSDSDKTVVTLLMDYYLEIKANSDTFRTKSLIYSGNESWCSSEGKTTTIEDHIYVGLALFVDFKKHYITFDL